MEIFEAELKLLLSLGRSFSLVEPTLLLSGKDVSLSRRQSYKQELESSSHFGDIWLSERLFLEIILLELTIRCDFYHKSNKLDH